MDDREDRELTLQEIKTSAYHRMTDSVRDYNEFCRKHFPKEPFIILQTIRKKK